MNIAETIRELRGEYIAEGEAQSYYEINNGLCDQFADDLYKKLKSFHDVDVYCGWNFMMGKDGEKHLSEIWDWELLNKHWDVKLPKGLTKDELDSIDFGAHDFIAIGRRFYDSECPEGVSSFFDLPVFRRPIITALRKKGIHTLDIFPEDLVPPPLCPVPNPAPKYFTSNGPGF